MDLKPRGWERRYAEWFDDATVVESYRYRPAYPPSLFGVLAGLARDGDVLDAGCGPGDIARPLAPLVRHVDAVDLSARMVAEGRLRPGGDTANLTWLASPIEGAGLPGPYALVVAGDSVHWFDWPVVMPLFERAGHLRGSPGDRHAHLVPLDPAVTRRLAPIYRRYGANRDFRSPRPRPRAGTAGSVRPRWRTHDGAGRVASDRRGGDRLPPLAERLRPRADDAARRRVVRPGSARCTRGARRRRVDRRGRREAPARRHRHGGVGAAHVTGRLGRPGRRQLAWLTLDMLKSGMRRAGVAVRWK